MSCFRQVVGNLDLAEHLDKTPGCHPRGRGIDAATENQKEKKRKDGEKKSPKGGNWEGKKKNTLTTRITEEELHMTIL